MNRLKSIIRLGATDNSVSERGGLPIQKVFYLGKSAESVILFPYGMHARPKPNWLSLIFTYGARSENRWHMVTSAEKRPTDLKEGEVVFYHPATMAEIRLKSDGTIEATTSLFKVNGNLQVTGTSTLEDTLEVLALTTTAGIATSGTTTANFGATITSLGQDISNTHTHGTGTYKGDGDPATPAALDSGSSGVPDS